MSPSAKAQNGPSSRLRQRRVLVAIGVGLVIAGCILGVWLLPPEWNVLRRLAAGAVGGAGVGLIVSATRLIG